MAPERGYFDIRLEVADKKLAQINARIKAFKGSTTSPEYQKLLYILKSAQDVVNHYVKARKRHRANIEAVRKQNMREKYGR